MYLFNVRSSYLLQLLILLLAMNLVVFSITSAYASKTCGQIINYASKEDNPKTKQGIGFLRFIFLDKLYTDLDLYKEQSFQDNDPRLLEFLEKYNATLEEPFFSQPSQIHSHLSSIDGYTWSDILFKGGLSVKQYEQLLHIQEIGNEREKQFIGFFSYLVSINAPAELFSSGLFRKNDAAVKKHLVDYGLTSVKSSSIYNFLIGRGMTWKDALKRGGHYPLKEEQEAEIKYKLYKNFIRFLKSEQVSDEYFLATSVQNNLSFYDNQLEQGVFIDISSPEQEFIDAEEELLKSQKNPATFELKRTFIEELSALKLTEKMQVNVMLSFLQQDGASPMDLFTDSFLEFYEKETGESTSTEDVQSIFEKLKNNEELRDLLFSE